MSQRMRWIALGAVLMTLLLGACQDSMGVGRPVTATPARQAARSNLDLARLTVDVVPAGASVSIDDRPVGASPLEVELQPGKYYISITAPGCVDITELVELEAGRTTDFSPELRDIAPPVIELKANPPQIPWASRTILEVSASDNVDVAELQLLLDGQVLATTRGNELSMDLYPADVDGLMPGVHELLARAADEAGNLARTSLVLGIGAPAPTYAPPTATPDVTSTPTPTPRPATSTPTRVTSTPTSTFLPAVPAGADALPTETPVRSSSSTPTRTPTRNTRTPLPSQQATSVSLPATATPTITPTSNPRTQFRVEQIELPTYPYTAFLSAATDPGRNHYALRVLDRGAYEGSDPQPASVTYDLLVLENDYLRVSILPALGGRIYECVFKPTGNNEFYQNPVIKPTNWGPPGSDYPAGANWWLAAGGLEWGFPVEEHGYEWGSAWSYATATRPDGGVAVTLSTGSDEGFHVSVTIALAPDSALFTVQPRITNGRTTSFQFKWWDNAMLAPGAANSPGPDLRFILPADSVTVHSTGDEGLPGAGEAMSWPLFAGRDMSRLGSWKQWLGAFARPAASAGYMGVYDTAADEGMMRIFPPETVQGAKVFAMGYASPIDWRQWTDDGSGYVELHGGLMPTFDDWAELAAGESITWEEQWYPVAGIGHVSYATEAGAVNLRREGSTLEIGLFVTEPVVGSLEIDVEGLQAINRTVVLAPDAPLVEVIDLDATDVPAWGTVSVHLADTAGRVVLSHLAELQLQPPR